MKNLSLIIAIILISVFASAQTLVFQADSMSEYNDITKEYDPCVGSSVIFSLHDKVLKSYNGEQEAIYPIIEFNQKTYDEYIIGEFLVLYDGTLKLFFVIKSYNESGYYHSVTIYFSDGEPMAKFYCSLL